MNKAFIREPDITGTFCPRCGSEGQRVGEEVLQHYLNDERRHALTRPAYFCPAPKCEVAYFDGVERYVLAIDLQQSAYPKDPDAPLCACFGVTCEDIERDVAEGVVTRTRAAVQRAELPDNRCSQIAANGRSCVAHLQKYYMECLNRRKSEG